jgi:NDP-sugar pyrophosphorylase family protein
MIYYVLRRLASAGIEEVVVNVHHHADKMREYLGNEPLPNLRILISDESDLLRDTGGAIRHASALLRGSGPLLIHNADVITDLNLNEIISVHSNSSAFATLAVRTRPSSRYLLIDDRTSLVGWRNVSSGEFLWAGGREVACRQAAFSGVQVISDKLLDLMPAKEVFPIIPFLLQMAEHYTIRTYRHDYGLWTDLGRPDDLHRMEQWMAGEEGETWTHKYLDGWSPSYPA